METLVNLIDALQGTGETVINFVKDFVRPLSDVYPGTTFPVLGGVDIGTLSLLSITAGAGLTLYILYALIKFIVGIIP